MRQMARKSTMLRKDVLPLRPDRAFYIKKNIKIDNKNTCKLLRAFLLQPAQRPDFTGLPESGFKSSSK